MKILLHYQPEHLAEIYEASYAERIKNLKKEFRRKTIFLIYIFIISLILFIGLRRMLPFILPIFVVLYYAYMWYKYVHRHKAAIAKERETLHTYLDSLSNYKVFWLEVREDGLSLFLDDEEHIYRFGDPYTVYIFPDFLHFFRSDDRSKNVLLPRKSMTDREFEELGEVLQHKMDRS